MGISLHVGAGDTVTWRHSLILLALLALAVALFASDAMVKAWFAWLALP
jgi:hypothetical protein